MDRSNDILSIAEGGDVEACLKLANQCASLELHTGDAAMCIREYHDSWLKSKDVESLYRAAMGALEFADGGRPEWDPIGWLRIAAGAGHWVAQNNLSVIYRDGLYGELANDAEATWWSNACASNEKNKEDLQGCLIYPNNTKHWLAIDRACYWYEKSANGGALFGMVALALLLAGHRSTSGEAMMWLGRAGDKSADIAGLVAGLCAQSRANHPFSVVPRARYLDVLAAIAQGDANGSAAALGD